jgi:hypothetical protein
MDGSYCYGFPWPAIRILYNYSPDEPITQRRACLKPPEQLIEAFWEDSAGGNSMQLLTPSLKEIYQDEALARALSPLDLGELSDFIDLLHELASVAIQVSYSHATVHELLCTHT